MQMRQFQLRDEFIELSSLLKFEGVCSSGGEAKMLVAAGKVQVDGAVELRKACKIRAGQRVQAGDIQIEILAAPSAG
ncbi:MAG: RNA-binding S4 domain-containing protein [Planctomycetota bacterium]